MAEILAGSPPAGAGSRGDRTWMALSRFSGIPLLIFWVLIAAILAVPVLLFLAVAFSPRLFDQGTRVVHVFGLRAGILRSAAPRCRRLGVRGSDQRACRCRDRVCGGVGRGPDRSSRAAPVDRGDVRPAAGTLVPDRARLGTAARADGRPGRRGPAPRWVPRPLLRTVRGDRGADREGIALRLPRDLRSAAGARRGVRIRCARPWRWSDRRRPGGRCTDLAGGVVGAGDRVRRIGQ